MSRSKRRPVEEEMRTPLLSLIDFFANFSALINSLIDEIENRTPIAISKQSRAALFLALVLWLGSRYPSLFSLVLSGSSAELGAFVILGLGLVDIAVRTVRPRRFRIHEKLQEIVSGIVEEKYTPQDATTYLSDLSFASDLLDPLVTEFPKLIPVVQQSLVENQDLTAKQLKTLTSSALRLPIVCALVERYPQSFDQSLLEKWIREFNSEKEVILGIAKYQLGDFNTWETYIKGVPLTQDISRSLKVELTYAKNPNRWAILLKTHSNAISTVVVTVFFLGFVVCLGPQIIGIMPRTVAGDVAGSIVWNFALAIFFIMWIGLTSALTRILGAFGNWIDSRAKRKTVV